jgi:myo-inositol 2-dehydrogenase/D-chiro-inositol 1-dehydrogenase/scyllo-inositol 2-dehydrogenase (NAD+)
MAESQPVRVCLVGAGRAGQVHANTLTRHTPAGRLVALVDSSAEARQAVGDRYGIEARFSTLEEALERARFDAVIITTPTFTHKELAVMAAEAGKHILCEKPMALTLDECDQMIQAAARSSVHLQIGFMRRFDPEFEAAAMRIEAGEIGRPMMVKSLTHGPGLPPPWALDPAMSNGMLAEVNSHDWDTVRWLMGSNIARVYAEVANFKGPERGVSTPNFYDNALVNIRFESGGLGSISGVCPCEYGYDARVEIIGERGIIQIGDLRAQALVVCVDREQGLVTPVYSTWPQRFASAYIREVEHFIECVRTDTPPRVGGADGRAAVAAVLAATTSFLEGRPVYVREVVR